MAVRSTQPVTITSLPFLTVIFEAVVRFDDWVPSPTAHVARTQRLAMNSMKTFQKGLRSLAT